MKHTKGEWTYSQQRGKQGHCYAAQVWDDTGDCLATLRATENEEEATANAKLIASAPELLKACINLRDDLIKQKESFGEDRDLFSPKLNAQIGLLNTVILKATQ